MDASAKHKCDVGVSLNDFLLKGPDLITRLVAILLRFRQHPIAVSGDIKAMYHTVKVIEEDEPALRFLWRRLKTNRYISNVTRSIRRCIICYVMHVCAPQNCRRL